MDKTKLITILTEIDEGTKTAFKAYNEILSLFSVSQCTCEIPINQAQFNDRVFEWTCFKCKKPS